MHRAKLSYQTFDTQGIPYNTRYVLELVIYCRTQKARRIEEQLKVVEKSRKKRKITKKQVKKLIDRNVRWKKQIDAKIYTQKLERELEEKQS